MESSCLVVLSGGADSTICATIAKTKFKDVHALTFNYGQRHSIEIESAIAVAKELELVSHEIVEINNLLISSSPLVSENKVEKYETAEELPNEIASTFVPMRNQLFLTIAANRAIALEVDTIFTGTCQLDYSGYPDCRHEFMDMLQKTTSLGNFGELGKIHIETPLMYKTKSESITLAKRLLGDRFESVMEKTHTCYNGIKGGCGECAACLLRDRGFRGAGIEDPIWKYR